MQYLGIDTSGSVAAVALYDTEQDLFLGQQSIYTKRTHSQIILPLMQRLLSDCGTSLSALDGIAVAVGPGSYTGLRIGIAAVKALTFGLEIPCFGISTLEALAYPCSSGTDILAPMMQARQHLVYAGLYERIGEKLHSLLPDGVYDIADFKTILTEKKLSPLLIGDAAPMYAEALGCRIATANLRLQNAAGLCMAAVHHTPQTPDQLEASYLQKVKIG